MSKKSSTFAAENVILRCNLHSENVIYGTIRIPKNVIYYYATA